VYQFDRLLPNGNLSNTKSGYQPSSTQPQPLQFPQFAAIDSIDSWAIWRLGMRNRLQTRRDGDTYDWIFLDTFADINGNNPYVNGPYSNLNNILTFAPVSWFNLKVGSQIPLDSQGFSEFNTDFSFHPLKSFSFTVGTRYINNYNGVTDQNQYPISAFWRVNDNWSMSASGIYNTQPNEPNQFISETYMINRDLSSWIMSFGLQVFNNQTSSSQSAQTQYGALLTFTLKDFPQVTVPLALSPSGGQGGSSSPLSAGH
jgi:hypothetical protein